VRRTERARSQAVALRVQGLPSREIAQHLELPVSTVAAWLRRRPTFAVRACRLCGQRFVPTNGRQRFCTPAHQREHQHGRPRTTRDCRLCGQRFTPTNGRQRFCTAAHQREHQRLHGTPRTVEGWREHVQRLEAELAQLQAQLPAREAA
jgi:Sigma-70, region 4